MKRVVIVGGGVVGLFCAVRLAKAGARVTVLEAEGEHPDVFGPGASIAAAGMLAPLDEASSPHASVALESYDFWRTQRDRAEWADGVRFDGGIVLKVDGSQTADLVGAIERHNRRARVLSASQVRKLTGLQAHVDAAVFIEDEGVADPARVLSGLAMQVRAHGVIVDYNQDVADVAKNEAKTHDGRVYEADAVILAPGAWATEKLISAAPALRHVSAGKGDLAAVRLERRLGPNVHGPGFYIAERRDDVVLGATFEAGRYDRRVDSRLIEHLFAVAEAVLPGEVKPAGRSWAGIRPMSPDGWPLIGPSGDGLFVAAGHSRNGWLLAPVTAEIITAYVFSEDVPSHWAALSPQRFETQMKAS